MTVSKLARAFLAVMTASPALLAGGCASTVQRWDAENSAFESAHAAAIEEVKRTAPTCEGEADCAAKWDAAQVYVQKTSSYRIQTVSSAIIQTYGPLDDNTGGLAFSVIKEPQGAGRYRIVPTVSCFYPHACGPAADQAALLFNRAVSAIQK